MRRRGRTGHGDGRYDTYLNDVPIHTPAPLADDGGCWLRRGRGQPMRNLALAEVRLAADEADQAIYVRCAPDNHPTIWRRLAGVRAMSPDAGPRLVRGMTANTIAALHPDRGATFAALYAPQR
jgi:hypothetical protein